MSKQDAEEPGVYITTDCGCRFQIVSGMPVLDAGVLAMPDVAKNVCETHRVRQEEAYVSKKRQRQQEQEEAAKPKIELVKADGSPMDGSGRTIVRRN